MASELDLLNEQNVMLNEQVKLLIRTEKQLYRANKTSQQHINLIRSLSEFSIRCGNEIDVAVILSNAMELLCSTFPFDVGIGLAINPEFNRVVISSFEKGKGPSHASFESPRESFYRSALTLGCSSPILNPSPTFNTVFPKVRSFLKDIEADLSCPCNTEVYETHSLLIPIGETARDERGFLLVGRRSKIPITIHEKFPLDDDLPFLSLLQSHIKAAIGNAMAHHRQRDFAKLLEKTVEEKTQELQRTQSILIEASRKAGIAEIATNILHNVGNVLNSVATSSSQIAGHLSGMRFESLRKCSEVLGNSDSINQAEFSQLLIELHGHYERARGEALNEVKRLNQNTEHIKQIVNAQMGLAKNHLVLEKTSLESIIAEASRMAQTDAADTSIHPKIRVAPMPDFWIDRHKVLQILVNLIKNAAESISATDLQEKRLEISTDIQDQTCIIRVKDNGLGIAAQNLARIFGQGFTTKKTGHGFGLHGSANAASQMSGRLYATSEGVGLGACFTLEIPFKQDNTRPTPEAKR